MGSCLRILVGFVFFVVFIGLFLLQPLQNYSLNQTVLTFPIVILLILTQFGRADRWNELVLNDIV